MKKSIPFAMPWILWLGLGCQPGPTPSPDELVEGSGALSAPVVIAPEIPAKIRALLERDLALIAAFDATTGTAADDELKQVLGVADLRGATLLRWLSERVRALLGEKMSVYPVQIVYPRDRTFLNYRLPAALFDQDSYLTSAQNTGVLLYDLGYKRSQQGQLLYLRVQVGDGWVDVLSPRVGLVQIGPAYPDISGGGLGGLFARIPDDSYAGSALRIPTLFHEARHSDGNRASGSLGFSHVDCPSGNGVPEGLVGLPACDPMDNGGYRIGALIARAFLRKCGTQCSAQEQRMIEALYQDNLARVIRRPPSGSSGIEQDSTPEPGYTIAVDLGGFRPLN